MKTMNLDMKHLCAMICVATALFSFSARADTWSDTAGYAWSYSSDGLVAIVQGVSPAGGSVSIPSTLGGKPVTSIGEYAFYGCSGLTSVTIPDSEYLLPLQVGLTIYR